MDFLDNYTRADESITQYIQRNNRMVRTGNALNTLVRQYGADCYRDLKWLEESMTSMDADPICIQQIILIARVPGFERIIGGKGISKMDVDTFVINAYEQTGITKPVILSLVQIILQSIDPSYIVTDFRSYSEKAAMGTAYVIPYSFYAKELDQLQAQYQNQAKDRNYYSRLRMLADYGVPKAKYILGSDKFNADNTESDDAGVEDIAEAANLGDDEALRFMGSYYYNKGMNFWGLSYEYYTSCGSALLRKSDREKVIDIMQFGNINKMFVFGSFLLMIISAIVLLFTPGFNISTGGYVVIAIGLILEAFIACLGMFKFLKNPYDARVRETLLIFMIWSICMIIKIGM